MCTIKGRRVKIMHYPGLHFVSISNSPTLLGSRSSPSVCVLEQVMKAPELQVLVIPSLVWWRLTKSVQHAGHER